jgi:hypothetical protein
LFVSFQFSLRNIMKRILFTIAILISTNFCILAQEKTPLEIKVSIYVIGISKISTQTSSYTMDFYLTLTCNRNCEKEKDYKFEIINGKIASSRITDDKPNYKVYRINADLVSNFDFRMYPFEKPELTLIIEDENSDSSKLVFATDAERSAIDEHIPSFGWQANRINETICEHFYPNFNQRYSSYRSSIVLSRPFWSSILKLLPAIAIMFACLIAFVMTPSIADRRIVLVTSSLIVSVLFHANLASGVPQVPFLTVADRFMVINYLIIAASLLIVGLMLVWNEKHPEKANRLQQQTWFSIPCLWLILQIVNSMI